jgi:hypothetical protein
MRIKLDGFFTEFELSVEEEQAALANPLLLAFIQNKRAAYVAAFAQAQLTTASQGELLELERQRAKISILTELIDEIVQSQTADIESESTDTPN